MKMRQMLKEIAEVLGIFGLCALFPGACMLCFLKGWIWAGLLIMILAVLIPEILAERERKNYWQAQGVTYRDVNEEWNSSGSDADLWLAD